MNNGRRNEEPVITVGILKAPLVRFRPDAGYSSSGGVVLAEAPAEARVKEGLVEVFQEGRLVERGREVGFRCITPAAGSFLVRDVAIGIGFHWEQKEDQRFAGDLRLVVEEEQIRVINELPLEEYLVSVISSEMKADNAPALLRAHTIISRSWLLAQIEKQDALSGSGEAVASLTQSETEYIRWYGREDHRLFHVCADDHCQRYQGMTRASDPGVVRAVEETRGEVLVYGGRICDARFSKCCGGVTEEFGNCWEAVDHPYLQGVADAPAGAPEHEDLKVEANAVRFIGGRPEAFCNTDDETLLRRALNDYDLASKDFYRWKVRYSQEELSSLIRLRSGMDFGHILDLLPVQRGESGRLVKLKVVGSRRTLTVGKELEIRRWLSPSHLYSSAFFVELEEVQDGIPGHVTLHGAGWGHGVGLCQIGAAVMAGRGYSHREILAHYFRDTSIERRYE
jgi:stage II sporulation protein D